MLGLLGLFGLVIGLVLVVVFFKIVLAILAWPFQLLFWLLGGILQLILLPFQLLGIALLMVVLVAGLLIGVPFLLAVGVPLLVLAGLLLPILLVVGGLVLLGRLFASR